MGIDLSSLRYWVSVSVLAWVWAGEWWVGVRNCTRRLGSSSENWGDVL